jgi:hypothetical protein
MPVNTTIRRAAVSITAAGALALAGGGTAMADEASFEEDHSFESASAGPNGAFATSDETEVDADAYSETNHDGFDNGNHNGFDNGNHNEEDEEEDDGLLGLGLLSSDEDDSSDEYNSSDEEDDSLLGIL